MTTLEKAKELLKQINRQIDNAPIGEINGEHVDAGHLEEAAMIMEDVIASIQLHEDMMGNASPKRDDFAEHNVWNFAQTGVRA